MTEAYGKKKKKGVSGKKRFRAVEVKRGGEQPRRGGGTPGPARKSEKKSAAGVIGGVLSTYSQGKKGTDRGLSFLHW